MCLNTCITLYKQVALTMRLDCTRTFSSNSALSCNCCAYTISLITGRKGSLHHRKKSLSSSSPKNKRISNNYSPNTIANLAFFGDSTADSSTAIADMNLDLHTGAASKELQLPTPPLSCRSATSGTSSSKRDSAKQRKASTSATATTATAATKAGNRKSSNRLAYVANELAVEDLNVTSSSGKSTVQQRRCSTASSVASDVSAAGFQRVRTQSGAVVSTTLHSDQLAKQELTLKAQLRKVSTATTTTTATVVQAASGSSGNDDITDHASAAAGIAGNSGEQLIAAWCAYEDEHGNVYYWNDSTGESRWDVTEEMLVTPVSAAPTTVNTASNTATATSTSTAQSAASAAAAATAAAAAVLPDVVATTVTDNTITADATLATVATTAIDLQDSLTAAVVEVTSPQQQQQQHAQHERKISIASQLLALAIEKRQLEAKLAAAAVVQCTVCMHAAVTRQVLPCEHKMCFQCSLKGIEQSGQCSVCQAAVTSVIKLEAKL
jgi:Zinc finger, C3HC4 type (RING finger)